MSKFDSLSDADLLQQAANLAIYDEHEFVSQLASAFVRLRHRNQDLQSEIEKMKGESAIPGTDPGTYFDVLLIGTTGTAYTCINGIRAILDRKAPGLAELKRLMDVAAPHNPVLLKTRVAEGMVAHYREAYPFLRLQFNKSA